MKIGDKMTFSIVGMNEKSIGVGVASGSVSVGERVPWVKNKIGAIATQAYTETMYGKRGLELLEQSLDPAEVLKTLLEKDSEPEKRQVGILKKSGEKALHTGEACPEETNTAEKQNCIALGNMLQNKKTITNMANKFCDEDGKISVRLLKALETGAKTGGDRRGNQTAALVVKGEEDLRFEIDKRDKPVQKLKEKVIG